MAEAKKDNQIKKSAPVKKPDTNTAAAAAVSKSVYGERKKSMKTKRKDGRPEKNQDEFEQKIVDLARVTRVMAGGKRMRFRATVAIGNRKGKVGLGMDKGADVTIAVTKAVTKAKKNIIDVPMINDTIPHEIYHKLGSAKVLFKPARKGKGVMAGGATRIILELAGIKNITSKNLGTNNNVNVAKAAISALSKLRKPDVKKTEKKEGDKVEEVKKDDVNVETIDVAAEKIA